MCIQRIVFFSATVVAMLLAVCASVSHKQAGEFDPTIIVDGPDRIFDFGHLEFPIESIPSDQSQTDIDQRNHFLNDAIRLTAPQANAKYLRNANLVPTDLMGTGAETRAWYEANATRVDNGSASIFGARDYVPIIVDLDGTLRMLDQSDYRTPGSDPDPDR